MCVICYGVTALFILCNGDEMAVRKYTYIQPIEGLFKLWYIFIFHLSGSVIVIYGAEKNVGKFTVEDYCTADLAVQKARPSLSSDRYSRSQYCVHNTYMQPHAQNIID